jgi:hypothetical protein
VEGPRGGTGTAAPRCSGDDDGATTGSAGPSRAGQLQEDELWLVSVRNRLNSAGRHVTEE